MDDAPVLCKSGGMKSASHKPIATALPAPAWFVVSALFHYLGPAFAVLLFARVAPLGVAWLRIATSALLLAAWRRPWRHLPQQDMRTRRTIAALGLAIGGMNACFYLAIDRLPLATVGAIEFIGPIALAAAGLRSTRNRGALGLAAAGVVLLTRAHLVGSPLGLFFAFANAGLFTLYIVFGHRLATVRHDGSEPVDRLAAAMLVAVLPAALLGFLPALPAMASPVLLAAGAGVGVCSSVIPYVCDQFAMARLPRASFALLLSLLPAIACLVGALVLRQFPGPREALGIGLVAAAVALHRPRAAEPSPHHPREVPPWNTSDSEPPA
jgi:inner membrane transporter RhtA